MAEEQMALSEKLKEEVDNYIQRSCKELDKSIARIVHHPNPANMSDKELERACLEIPALLYRLEELITGWQYRTEIANMVEKHVANHIITVVKGTQVVKQAKAFNETIAQRMDARAKAYYLSRLRLKRELAEKVFDGVRKIVTQRMSNYTLSRKDTFSA